MASEPACGFEWVNHGETQICDIVGEHESWPGDNGGRVDHHFAWQTFDAFDHPEDCSCSRSPECRGTTGPIDVRVGFADPTLA